MEIFGECLIVDFILTRVTMFTFPANNGLRNVHELG